jgi:hypothetical protein
VQFICFAENVTVVNCIDKIGFWASFWATFITKASGHPAQVFPIIALYRRLLFMAAMQKKQKQNKIFLASSSSNLVCQVSSIAPDSMTN